MSAHKHHTKDRMNKKDSKDKKYNIDKKDNKDKKYKKVKKDKKAKKDKKDIKCVKYNKSTHKPSKCYPSKCRPTKCCPSICSPQCPSICPPQCPSPITTFPLHLVHTVNIERINGQYQWTSTFLLYNQSSNDFNDAITLMVSFIDGEKLEIPIQLTLAAKDFKTHTNAFILTKSQIIILKAFKKLPIAAQIIGSDDVAISPVNESTLDVDLTVTSLDIQLCSADGDPIKSPFFDALDNTNSENATIFGVNNYAGGNMNTYQNKNLGYVFNPIDNSFSIKLTFNASLSSTDEAVMSDPDSEYSFFWYNSTDQTFPNTGNGTVFGTDGATFATNISVQHTGDISIPDQGFVVGVNGATYGAVPNGTYVLINDNFATSGNSITITFTPLDNSNNPIYAALPINGNNYNYEVDSLNGWFNNTGSAIPIIPSQSAYQSVPQQWTFGVMGTNPAIQPYIVEAVTLDLNVIREAIVADATYIMYMLYLQWTPIINPIPDGSQQYNIYAYPQPSTDYPIIGSKVAFGVEYDPSNYYQMSVGLLRGAWQLSLTADLPPISPSPLQFLKTDIISADRQNLLTDDQNIISHNPNSDDLKVSSWLLGQPLPPIFGK